jgi:3-dehydroquinate synthase
MTLRTLYFDHPTGRTPITIGQDLLNTLTTALEGLPQQVVILTDTTVHTHYGKALMTQLKPQVQRCEIITVPPGESAKTRAYKEHIEDQMLEAGYGRDTVLIALGGGVVTDLGGYVAATYCRGIPFLSLPTTLLAMVDAAIGGKNGVNTPQGKNLIGTFYHPQALVCDVATRHTLPVAEHYHGLAECLKHALLQDCALFDEFERTLTTETALTEASTATWIDWVYRSAQVKCAIAAQDTQEHGGIRQLLNLGHTVAHAIERNTDYTVPHGRAVMAGLWINAALSSEQGHLATKDCARIQRLITTLPPMAWHIDLTALTNEALHQAMLLDKKSRQGVPQFVLLAGIGKAYHAHNRYAFPMPEASLYQAIDAFRALRPTP